jgi:hypothetical protein
MTTTEAVVTAPTTAPGRAPWVDLARIEVGRYVRRPAFLIGTALTYAALLPYLDGNEPTDELSMIAPAALIGMVGISVSAHRVWASDRCATAAGPTPVTQASRTLGHLVACLVPFVAGLGFVLVTLLRSRSVPTIPEGYAAMMSDAWVAAVWIALGAVSCLGGPILGVVVARRTHRAAAPILATVGLVLAVIVFQGLFEPLRRVRVVLPWTYWGGPFGVDGDPERSIVLSGSPGWWLVYLLALCGIGALVAVRSDPDARSARSRSALVVLAAVAVGSVLLAMWTGTPGTLVSPVAADGTSWGG